MYRTGNGLPERARVEISMWLQVCAADDPPGNGASRERENHRISALKLPELAQGAGVIRQFAVGNVAPRTTSYRMIRSS